MKCSPIQELELKPFHDNVVTVLCMLMLIRSVLKLYYNVALTVFSIESSMALLAVLFVLIGSVSLSASQSCGSLQSCTQVYDASCPIPDYSSDVYDNTMTTQSSCSNPVGPTMSL